MKLSETLRHIRGIPFVAMGLLLGLILLFLPQITARSSEDAVQKLDGEAAISAYAAELEHRIAQMTEALTGDSSASVLVTVDCSAETVYAKETTANGKDTYQTSYLLASGNQPVPVREVTPKIRGIAVICRGGDDPQLQLAVIHMLTAAFGIAASHVFVGAPGT